MSVVQYSSLEDIGPMALAHRDEIEEVKRQLGIKHGVLDAWMYGFLENKKFNIEETVAKLQRRFAMEVNELATYEMTDYMREYLRKGSVQLVGEDKLGRLVVYMVTKRDTPQSKYRAEQKRLFDMFICYATRLREDNKRCQMVMLINHEDAGMWKNMDMQYQADTATRISKYYPGGVDKMYMCNMGRTFSAMLKSVFSGLPAIVSSRVQMFDSSDLKAGALLEIMDPSVLPMPMGGQNDCDHETNWEKFAQDIENYYMELKVAVNVRGMTVKEWEMEKIGLDPSTGIPLLSVQANRKSGLGEDLARSCRAMQSVSHRDDKRGETDSLLLMTCLSEDKYNDGADEDAEAAGKGATWASIAAALPPAASLFFLEQLLEWRTAIEEIEVSERYRLLEKFLEKRMASDRAGFRGVDINDSRWYLGIPQPLRALYQLVLMGITVLASLYFVGAIVFLAVLTANISVTVFLGFFTKPSAFFPLICVLMMCAMQGTAACSRGTDIITALYKGHLVPPLEFLGSQWGTFAEMLLFMILVLVQLIIFCVYAVNENPLRGLQVSFATGWLSALFIIAFHHAIFFTGFLTRKRDSEKSLVSVLPFFLALNIKDTNSEVDQNFVIRTSSFVICGIPIVISLLLGIGFLISRIVALYVCTIVSTMVAAFCVNYYSDDISGTLSGVLMGFSLWMMCIVWLYVTFTFGFRDFSGSWSASVIVSSILHGTFVILAFSCLQRKGSSWLLRVSFTIVLLYLLACWISSFPLIGWKMGLFALAIGAHNILNVMLAPKNTINISGMFLVGAGITLLSISCVLLGWYGTTVTYDTPRSLPPGSPSPTLTPLQLYHHYPICSLRIGDDDSLTVVDLAFMNEITKASDSSLALSETAVWFASRSVVYDGVVQSFKGDGSSFDFHRFTDSSAKTSILILTAPLALPTIMAMVLWIDSIAISPLSIFLPWTWTNTIDYVLSFVSRLIPFTSLQIYEEIFHYVDQQKTTLAPNTVIVSGTGISGGVLAVAGSVSATSTITFSSPGLLHLLRKTGLSLDSYHSNVLNVGAEYGIVSGIGGQDVTVSQKMRCSGNARYCNSHTYILAHLLSACGDDYGRHYKDDGL